MGEAHGLLKNVKYSIKHEIISQMLDLKNTSSSNVLF